MTEHESPQQQKIKTTNLQTKQVAITTQPDQELESKTVTLHHENKTEKVEQGLGVKDAELTSSVNQVESPEVEESKEIQPIAKIDSDIANKSVITIHARGRGMQTSNRILHVYWIDYDTNRQLYGTINRFGNTYSGTSYVGHSWCLTDICNDEVVLFQHICQRDEATIYWLLTMIQLVMIHQQQMMNQILVMAIFLMHRGAKIA